VSLFAEGTQGAVHTDEAGRRVEIIGRPSRIVSLAPSITECLFALGADEEVVGVTRFSNYPPRVASRPKVGTYVNVNAERVIGLRPDLVIAIRDGNPRAVVERLAAVGIPVYVVDPRNLEDLFEMVKDLGALLQRQDEAAKLLAELSERLRWIRARVAGRGRPRVLLQVGIDPLVSVSRGTLQDHLIDLAGGHNIATAAPVLYPALSIESVLEARPEVILVSSMVGETDATLELQKWRRWKALPAVGNDRLFVINGDLIDRPSPRVLAGLEEMARLIHPEAFN
jgi:iron complex transport system substrate-binding protein